MHLESLDSLDSDWTTGTGEGDGAPAPLHRALGPCLLRIGLLARQTAPAEFLHASMLALREHVGFDAAWWGEVIDAAPAAGVGTGPRNLLHASIGLSPTFAQEWNRDVAAVDTFALSTMADLGTVFRASGHYRGPPGAVAEFVVRHRLYCILTMTIALDHSGLLFFICLYRHDPQAGFSDAESAFFADVTRHLAQAWQHRVADLLSLTMAGAGAGAVTVTGTGTGTVAGSGAGTVAGGCAGTALALADHAGRLHYLGQGMAQVLARYAPDWTGTVLPPAVSAAFLRAPCALRLAGASLWLEPVGQLMAVTVRSSTAAQLLLSPRELGAALLYTQGHSSKQVARLLGLSPSTVRTYLRDAYRALGVSNKIGLAAALGRHQRPG